jgi:phosphoribosylanthranilate isomerase
MVRVKICGLTNLEDALAAARLGADALGFVFADSPRRVEPDVVRAIVRRLPPLVTTIGVFVDQPRSAVLRIMGHCGLDLIQLHGRETEAEARAFGRRVIKALAVGDGRPPAIESYPDCLLLLDTFSTRAAGGTGRSFDWDLAAGAARKRPVILAGGLNPDNVAQAIDLVQPDAVDVCSGVEISKGKKDHDRMASFIDRVRRARRTA